MGDSIKARRNASKANRLGISAISIYAALLIVGSILAGLPANRVTAAELSVAGQGGVDTNPHRLSSSLDPDLEIFGLLDAKFSNRFDNGVSIKARSKHAFYPDDDRADWSRNEFDLGFRDRFEVALARLSTASASSVLRQIAGDIDYWASTLEMALRTQRLATRPPIMRQVAERSGLYHDCF